MRCAGYKAISVFAVHSIERDCPVSPCLNFRDNCRRARVCHVQHCVSDWSGAACRARYFDGRFDELKASQCRPKILRRGRRRQQQPSADGGNKSPAGSKALIRQNKSEDEKLKSMLAKRPSHLYFGNTSFI
jgi:hypothetical protein